MFVRTTVEIENEANITNERGKWPQWRKNSRGEVTTEGTMTVTKLQEHDTRLFKRPDRSTETASVEPGWSL